MSDQEEPTESGESTEETIQLALDVALSLEDEDVTSSVKELKEFLEVGEGRVTR